MSIQSCVPLAEPLLSTSAQPKHSPGAGSFCEMIESFLDILLGTMLISSEEAEELLPQ